MSGGLTKSGFISQVARVIAYCLPKTGAIKVPLAGSPDNKVN